MINWAEREEIMKVNNLFRLLLIFSADKKRYKHNLNVTVQYTLYN